MELTNTNVRYLLTIYHLSQARLEVSSKDIAQTLDVSRASVTSMMSILTDKRLVTKERYGKVHLTDDGYRWARVLASQTDKLAETLQNRMLNRPTPLNRPRAQSKRGGCPASEPTRPRSARAYRGPGTRRSICPPRPARNAQRIPQVLM